MARLSKYFTPVLESCDKRKIVEILGLSPFSFDLMECLGEVPVFFQHWKEQRSETKIVPSDSLPTQSPRVAISHFGVLEKPFESSSQQDGAFSPGAPLFEQLLPYPYRLFFGGHRLSSRIDFYPEPFAIELERLRSLVDRLEGELSRFELSVLQIDTVSGQTSCLDKKDVEKTNSISLLFHFVRKKLIRVGTLPALSALADKFHAGKLAPSDLRQFFGTSSAFFHLSVRKEQKKEMDSCWEDLASAIESTLSDPSRRILGESMRSWDGEMELMG